MARITLRYSASTGVQSPALFASRFGAVDLLDGELEQLGMIVLTDETTFKDRLATRTIVLETTAQGDCLWQTDEELRAATRKLYEGELALRVPAHVRSAEPEVTH